MTVATWNLANTTDVMLNATTDGNFSAFGGGAAGLQVETDFFVEGVNCESKDAWSSGLKGMQHDENTVDLAVGTDEVAMVWQIYHIPNALTDNSGGGETGMQVRAGTDVDSNYWYFNVGDDVSLFGETWVPWVVNWDNSLESGTVGTPSGTIDWIGGGVDVSGGPSKGAPFAIDAIRYGRFELQYRAGTTPDPANTFALTEAHSNANAQRWGVLEERQGTYLMQGFHSFGDASNAVTFTDADAVLFWRDTPFAPAGFNRIEIENASTDVDWDNIIIQALGTQSPGTFVVTSGAFDAVDCQFIGMGTFAFLSSSSATATKFAGCDTITAPGTDLQGSSVLLSTVAADTAALVWDTATDTDALLDGMVFEQGAADHHAIEFTTFATSFDLVGIDFVGFNAGTDHNGSTLYFPDTGSDRAWVVNLIGVTGTVTSKKVRGGDTVTLVIDPVALTLTVTDTDLVAISGARALVTVGSGIGGWPFEATISIVRATTTATVTHTSHGLATNDFVVISGATQEEYNKVAQITVTDVDTYTYTVVDAGASPATGTPVATFAVISGTTNGSGVIAATYSYTANQPISGRIRDATAPPPYYKTSPITGTIDSAAGLSIAVQMISDE